MGFNMSLEFSLEFTPLDDDHVDDSQRLQRFGRKVHVLILIILNTTYKSHSLQDNL